MAQMSHNRTAVAASRQVRPSSVASDESSSIPPGELDALLQRLDGSQLGEQESLDLLQLEKFFSVCARALATKNHSLSDSRATTFAINADDRPSVVELEKPQQKDSRSRQVAGRNRESVQLAYAANAELLLDEQIQDWSGKKKDWQEILDKVEDVWQYYFPTCGHSDDSQSRHEHVTKCHPLCDPVRRKHTQQDIVLARICLEHDSSSITDASRFLPWLSLLGAKLEQLHSLNPRFAGTFVNSCTDDVETSYHDSILVTILRYFYEGPFHYLACHNESRIGDMLDFCYVRQVLPRPSDLADPVLEENFRCLVHGLWCLNIIQTPRYRLTFTYPWNATEQRLPVLGFYILGLQPSSAVMESFEEIERRLEEDQPDLPIAKGENVRCRHMSIRALRKIGGLTISWSMCDRDHLFLDQENGILRLSFQSRTLVPEFYKYMPMLGRNDVSHTWELLLGHRKHQYDYAELDKIALPPELKALSQLKWGKSRWPKLHQVHSGRPLGRPGDISDIYDKYDSLPNLPRSVPYTYFGRYEERVRILRHYMDTRKPTGFKNLWHDRRDSLSYYTFWAVLIFGGVSVLLAALGLVVGIMQAYASFKALDQ